MKIPRVVLAGATSGTGKTSISCGLIYALKNHGYSVQPFKVGPDYIDPSYLSSVSGNESYNLDSWLMGNTKVLESFVSNSNCDISVIEGVMGFYDGFKGDSNFASTHHIANITNSPVILVLDASKTSRSVAAMALGFYKFHRNSCICGVILNKLGSKKHEYLCRQALEQIRLPVLGAVYRDTNVLESRHLGLIPVTAQDNIKKKLVTTSKIISNYLDIQKILEIIHKSPPLPKVYKKRRKKPKVTISVALDSSFNFYYRDNLDALEREGANLNFFSPIYDNKLDDTDGVYIGGGFPEIQASQLEKNQTMKRIIKKLSDDNIPIYAECGGLMYLTKLIKFEGKKYKMAGIFDAETEMTKKMTLNYTKGTISKSIISDKLKTFHGHEFHYSKLYHVQPSSKFASNLQFGTGIKDGNDGMILGNTLASYGHLYFDRSDYAFTFVKNCKSSSRR